MTNYGNATAFIEILLSKDAHLEGTIQVKKGTSEEAKIKDVAHIYRSTLSDAYFIQPIKKINNITSSEISDHLLSILKPKRIVCLETLYKTMINHFDFDSLPFGVLASSSVPQDQIKGLGHGDIKFTSGIGSLCSAFLSYSQMENLQCILFISVIDQYQFSTETFDQFKVLLKFDELRSHLDSIEKLSKKPLF